MVSAGKDAPKLKPEMEVLKRISSRPTDEKIPEPVLKKAVWIMAKRYGIKATRRGFRCLARQGDVYLLRHHHGQLLAIDHKPGSEQADYYYECYLRNIGAYFYEGSLLKVHVEARTDNFEIVSIKGLERHVYQLNARGGEPKRIFDGYISELNMWIKNGRISDAVIVDEGMLSGIDEGLSHYIGGKEPGSVTLIKFDDEGYVSPVRGRIVPRLGLATDSGGLAYIVPIHPIGDSGYVMGLIPDHSNLGEFEFDGSGDHQNIRIFKREDDITFRDASDEEVGALAGLDTESLRSHLERFEGKNAYAEFNFPRVKKTGEPRGITLPVKADSGSIAAFSQNIEVATRPFNTSVEVIIEAGNRDEYESRLEKIISMIERTPISLFRQVQRIEVFEKSATAYGLYSVDIGGVCSDGGKRVVLFEFGKNDDRDLQLLQHELWHSLHGSPSVGLWQKIMLAIKAGSWTEDSVIARETRSFYHKRSWAEYVAEAGSVLFAGGKVAAAVSAFPFIASALIAIIDEVELAPLEGTIAQ